MIGPEEHLQKEVKIIGRYVRCTEEGWEIEVDPSYVDDAIAAYDLEECSSSVSPATKGNPETKEDRRELLMRRIMAGPKTMSEEEVLEIKEQGSELPSSGLPLEGEAKQKFQSIAALINFAAPDRPEILFSTKECMKAMAQPMAEDEGKLRRLLRYLKGQPRANPYEKG